ncbi:unnamed protein product [marine sediment metagenome]|uniref:Uncharacterized protein n=1 Tax=marine sediment metagenome TaxID=412755 RepID=X1INN3_9ZZZZ
MPNGQTDPWADMRREIEQLLGYPRGAFDPTSNFLRDMERINRALGKGFVMLQDVMNPQQLLRKIESGLDSVVPRKRY